MMTDNEINTIKTDVALIKRDITQISQVYKKVDATLSQMSEITKTMAVQDKILENDGHRIALLEESLVKHTGEQAEFRNELSRRIDEISERSDLDREKRQKEIIEALDKMTGVINKQLEDQNKRITRLENWKWYVAGLAGILLIIINKISWAVLFGAG